MDKDNTKATRKTFRKMRLGLGLSQIALANRAGLSNQKLVRWENGRASFNPEEMDRLGAALDAAFVARTENAPGKFTGPEGYAAVNIYRRSHGITQEELARRAKIPQATISNFENGHIKLDAKEMGQLEEALNSLIAETHPEKRIPLSSLMARQAPPATEESNPLSVLSTPLQALLKDAPDRVRIGVLAELVAAYAQRVPELEKEVQSQKQLNDGYRKLHETDLKIQELLKETGPGSAAMEAVKMLDEVEKLRAENAELRSWLNAEELAAVANEKAAELRERVSVAGMRKENAEEESNG
jgi:transcriptional regulator with XRE-family HTH domain